MTARTDLQPSSMTAHEPRALKCGRFASTHDCG
jgi:hypothetical protein